MRCSIKLFRERLSEKNAHPTIPKGNMGYDQYTVPDDCSCRTYFCYFPLALANTFPWPFVPILSNFFEKKRTLNRPQCLSGLSRTVFPTTFLEIAVFTSTQHHAPSAGISVNSPTGHATELSLPRACKMNPLNFLDPDPCIVTVRLSPVV